MSVPKKRPFSLKAFVPHEVDVQRAILHYLRYDRRVAWAARFNSGAAVLPCGGGKFRPIKFNTLEGCSDIMGQLVGGWHLSIEVKRPGWTKPTDKREEMQAEHIDLVNKAGGLAFFCTCPTDAMIEINEFLDKKSQEVTNEKG